MDWGKVGEWLTDNATEGAVLVGSLLTGNVPGAIAAGAALVASATGTNDPTKALVALQNDPAVMIRLKELAIQEEQHIRDHLRQMTEMKLKDDQAEQKEQQDTIRSGDNAADPYVRETRPKIARQSWYGLMLYILAFEAMKAGSIGQGAAVELSLIIGSPCFAYFGFRTADKAFSFLKKK